MNRPEIKSGYVLEISTSQKTLPQLVMVYYNDRDKLCFSNGDEYGDLENVEMWERKLLKIYGRTPNARVNAISIRGRQLLWENKIKEMTIEEVIEELGYEIKIIKGE